MSRGIRLTGGLVAVVADGDFDWLSRWIWHAVEGRLGSFYAARPVMRRRPDGTRFTSGREMQRVILDPDWVIPRTRLADHRDGDTLNNRRANLRWLDGTGRRLNTRTRQDNRAGYRGVHFVPHLGRYRAQVAVRGRRIDGGYHETAEAAAAAYDALARAHHGEHARLNLPERRG